MSSSTRSIKKTTLIPARSSIKLCETRYCCPNSHSEATYFCSECNNYQCNDCALELHRNKQYFEHNYHKIPLPHPDSLCQFSGCKSRNFADIICQNCNKIYCHPCDLTFHSNRSKSFHLRKNFVFESEEFLSCPENFEEQTMMQPHGPDVTLNDSKEGILSDAPFTSITLEPKSFLLVDKDEELQVKTEEEFIEKLGCDSSSLLKVVSIFGNTGDGKSYTLNHVCYGGHEVFATSENQDSCTMGVWAAFDRQRSIITLDTEGFLGQTNIETRYRLQRLLLKILAISDVVIYRTRASRLNTDVYDFLGLASRIYLERFSGELEALAKQHSNATLSSLGPSVIIFHETRDTEPLRMDGLKRPEDKLAEKFQEIGVKVDAFNRLEYIGVRTYNNETDFKPFESVLQKHLNNNVRSVRPPAAVFQAFKSLNEKFSGEIKDATTKATFLDALFHCPCQCLSCNAKCDKTVNHPGNHHSRARCCYQYQYKNEVFLCQQCLHKGGKRVEVSYKTSTSDDSSLMGTLSYLVSGQVLECPTCGVIYRTRQNWMGNKEPWEVGAVQKDVIHVWKHPEPLPSPTENVAQKTIDTVASITEAVASLSVTPRTMLNQIVTNTIRPQYWIPDSEIKACCVCSTELKEEIHHCRACGKGVCEKCSLNKKRVGGWLNSPVRVCDACYKQDLDDKDFQDTKYRIFGEAIQAGASTVSSVLQVPKAIIKDFSRPAYWQPDSEIEACAVCNVMFDEKIKFHHCRACGLGVCNECSLSRRPVPEHNFHSPVRVCKKCNKESS